MKERPILFSGPMVRAILEGRKTQTRRIIKPQPPSIEAVQARAGIDFSIFTDKAMPGSYRVAGPVWAVRELMGIDRSPEWRCPYGQPGDRLWVRETCVIHELPWREDPRPPAECFRARVTYLADGAQHVFEPHMEHWRTSMEAGFVRKRTSIHMPRWASRITLEIVSVRVERLQDISEDDARAEGLEVYNDDGVDYYGPFNKGHCSAKTAFSWLWDSINAKRAPWASNPWVWVVEFRRVP